MAGLGGQVQGGVNAVHVQQLQGQAVGVAGGAAPDEADEHFTVSGSGQHGGAHDVAQALAAGHVTHGAARPAGPRCFNGGVGCSVWRVGAVVHAGLQRKAGGAHHVGGYQAAKLARVGIVAHELAAAGAQVVQAGVDVCIGRQAGGHPAFRQAVDLRGRVAAALATGRRGRGLDEAQADADAAPGGLHQAPQCGGLRQGLRCVLHGGAQRPVKRTSRRRPVARPWRMRSAASSRATSARRRLTKAMKSPGLVKACLRPSSSMLDR